MLLLSPCPPPPPPPLLLAALPSWQRRKYVSGNFSTSYVEIWHVCYVSRFLSLSLLGIMTFMMFWLWYWQGAVESVSVGEIRLSLRQSLVKLGVSKDPKLQVLICDLEVVVRPSTKSTSKAKIRRPRTSGRGKWMVVANIARYLSVSVTDLVVKVCGVCLSILFGWLFSWLFFHDTSRRYMTYLLFGFHCGPNFLYGEAYKDVWSLWTHEITIMLLILEWIKWKWYTIGSFFFGVCFSGG